MDFEVWIILEVRIKDVMSNKKNCHILSIIKVVLFCVRGWNKI
jgi:hypothetical protein